MPRSTPMLTDRTANFMFASPALGDAIVTNPGKGDGNDGLCTPKKGSPSVSEHDRQGDQDLDDNECEEERPKLHVVFGNSKAAEFDTTRPTVEITALPDEVAGEQFPVEYVEETEEEVVLHKETVDNSAMLAEWEDEFDSFLDEDDGEEEQKSKGDADETSREGGGAPSSPMDCDDNESACSDASGCFADDDMTPLQRPKRPRKKKRRKSKHRYTNSAEKDERRKSSLFFSPGGGSLLASDDEDDTCVDATPMRDLEREGDGAPVTNLTVSSFSPEEGAAADRSPTGSLYISPPSSARSSLEGALAQNINASTLGGISPTDNASSGANKELFGANDLNSAPETNVDDDISVSSI